MMQALACFVSMQCLRCQKDANLRCSACNALYCSLQCQTRDWPTHSLICGRVGGGNARILITTAIADSVVKVLGYLRALPDLLAPRMPGIEIRISEDGSIPANYKPEVILVLDWDAARPKVDGRTYHLVKKLAQSYDNVVITWLKDTKMTKMVKYTISDIDEDEGGFDLRGKRRPLSLRLLVNDGNKLTEDAAHNKINITMLLDMMKSSNLL